MSAYQSGSYEKTNWDTIRAIPGVDDLSINAQKGAAIANDTVRGEGDMRNDYLDREKLNTLIIHARQDAATAVLNTALIYKELRSTGRDSRICRLIIVGILAYIAYKVS
ncbi:hypothetical protein [Acetobacter syzygii]|uniref:Uncharacterized protein n=1 Tax=Acetobacter syzygii TaxID=146476 RepID=A0A270B7Q7_9PROT|nr:hypothetical protein [Acetobacter syzygii]PAL21047.1 hypothetical protein B9K05_11860 [Acetobacter syzygii]PAL23378.1 hypothetical protein B9K04_11825 [Acetobacter syzygii]